MTELPGRLAAVSARVHAAAQAAGRDPDSVQLLLATKTQSAQDILIALRAGYRLIGENRVQEVVTKADALAAEPHTMHFIGHLQENKVNALLPHIRCLQTLDTRSLAQRLQRRLEILDRTLEVMIQVNVSGEENKSGIAPVDAADLVAAVRRHDRLQLTGLMTIGLNSPDLALVRAGYGQLRALAEELGVAELSMGMTGDFGAAIAEGATIVRLGSAVFGPRPRAL